MSTLKQNIKRIQVLTILLVFLFSGICISSTGSSTIHVSHYEFGKIIINDKEYIKDIAVWPNGDITPGPEDMHFLHISDFNELFKSGLNKLVIGSGDEGAMEMDFSRKLEKKIKGKGIELIMMDTHELVKFLNKTKKRDFLVLVHLNC